MVNKSVRFTEEAKIEFHKVKCYMALMNKEEEFWVDIEKQLSLIVNHPEAFQVRYKNVRIVFLERFNFSLHYVAKPYGVLVYRFLSQKQYF